MHYGTESMIPIEVNVPSFRYENFDEETNTLLLAAERYMLEERREVVRIRMEAQKQRTAMYYDSKEKERTFKVGDTVLRQVFQNTKEPGAGALGYSWEGPYQVTEVLQSGTPTCESRWGPNQTSLECGASQEVLPIDSLRL